MKIQDYKKRFDLLLESKMGNVKPLISEDDNNVIVQGIASKPIISENQIDENIFNTIADKWTGLKGIVRGYGQGYFEGMSKLNRLIRKLKKLDEPNVKVMNELKSLKNTVQSYNIPQQRKQNILDLIDNSIVHFEKYNTINDQILQQIDQLKLSNWK